MNKLLADPALTATIHNAERLTANLDVTTRQLNSLMNNELPQITGRLVTITDNFSVISENLKDIDYASTFSKVDSTLYNVQLLTEKLTRKDNTIGLLFNDPTFYQNLSTTTANAASLLEDLKALEAEGVEILTCGTCLNFYGLTEKLQVGTVTNMYVIAEKMLNAGNVVKP